jgi:hypothetical protein
VLTNFVLGEWRFVSLDRVNKVFINASCFFDMQSVVIVTPHHGLLEVYNNILCEFYIFYSCYMFTFHILSCRGVALTTHSHLAPRLKK